MKKLAKLLREQKFDPKFIGLFTNPVYFARKGIIINLKEFTRYINGEILDIGCGTKPYKRLFSVTSYTGLELDTPENRKNKSADVYYDGSTMPFKDLRFDSVLSSQVLEHVFTPDTFLKETNRILKMGGHLLLTVPFVWEEHEKPNDFARYSSFGLIYLLEKHGFEVIKHKKSGNNITVTFQLLANQIRKIAPKQRHLKLLTYVAALGLINISGLVLSKILPVNEDIYLDNIVIAKKTNNV